MNKRMISEKELEAMVKEELWKHFLEDLSAQVLLDDPKFDIANYDKDYEDVDIPEDACESFKIAARIHNDRDVSQESFLVRVGLRRPTFRRQVADYGDPIKNNPVYIFMKRHGFRDYLESHLDMFMELNKEYE